MEGVCNRCGKQESVCPERSGGDCTVCPIWKARVQSEAGGRRPVELGARLPLSKG